MEQIKIIFPKNYFQNQSQLVSLNEVLTSYRHYCGLFHHQFTSEISPHLTDQIILTKDNQSKKITYNKSDIEENSIRNSTKFLLSNLATFIPELQPPTDLFLKHDLWKLHILFTYCKDSQPIRQRLLQEYPETLLEKDYSQVDNEYIEFTKEYYHGLITTLKILEEYNTNSHLTPHLRKTYTSYADKLCYIGKIYHDIRYPHLACTISDALPISITDQLPKDVYSLMLKMSKIQQIDYEISETYYKQGNFLTKIKDYSKEEYLQKHLNVEKVYCDKQAIRYNPDKFEVLYTIALNGNSIWNLENGMIKQLNDLTHYLERRNQTIHSNLTSLLYTYKCQYHLGVLEFKANDDLDYALEFFNNADQLFQITIMNVLKRLELNQYYGTKQALSEFVYAELLFRYMSECYYLQEGIRSQNYKNTLERKRKFFTE